MITLTKELEQRIWERWAKNAGVDDIEPIKNLYNIEIGDFDTAGMESRLVLRQKQPQAPATNETKKAVQLLQPKDKPAKKAEKAGRLKRKVWVKEPNGRVCEFESLTAACKEFGFTPNCVQKYVGGKPYKFYTFSYEKIEKPKELVTLKSLMSKDSMVQKTDW